MALFVTAVTPRSRTRPTSHDHRLGLLRPACRRLRDRDRRLARHSHLLNDGGQHAYYGRTAGCLITGNEDSGGPDNDFTNRNTTSMTWNLLHMARMLKDRGGIPAHGNQRSEWDAGCRFDYPNPEYR